MGKVLSLSKKPSLVRSSIGIVDQAATLFWRSKLVGQLYHTLYILLLVLWTSLSVASSIIHQKIGCLACLIRVQCALYTCFSLDTGRVNWL